jgi:hypothetical protein
MAQPDSTPQPKPGYREATADPASLLVCQRCGALVADTETDLHDRFWSSSRPPATRSAWTSSSSASPAAKASTSQVTFHARAVIEVVGEAVTQGQLAKVRDQLPPEFDPLFSSGSSGQLRS